MPAPNRNATESTPTKKRAFNPSLSTPKSFNPFSFGSTAHRCSHKVYIRIIIKSQIIFTLSKLCRDAENRTRVLRTRSVCNTTIQHPDRVFKEVLAYILPLCDIMILVHYSAVVLNTKGTSHGRRFWSRGYKLQRKGLGDQHGSWLHHCTRTSWCGVHGLLGQYSKQAAAEQPGCSYRPFIGAFGLTQKGESQVRLAFYNWWTVQDSNLPPPHCK